MDGFFTSVMNRWMELVMNGMFSVMHDCTYTLIFSEETHRRGQTKTGEGR